MLGRVLVRALPFLILCAIPRSEQKALCESFRLANKISLRLRGGSDTSLSIDFDSSEDRVDDILFHRRSLNETELEQLDKQEDTVRFFRDLEANISRAGTENVFMNPILDAENTKKELEVARQSEFAEDFLRRASRTNDEAERYRLFTDYMTRKNQFPTLDRFELFKRVLNYQERLLDPDMHKAAEYGKLLDKVHEDLLGYLPQDPPDGPPEQKFDLKSMDSAESDGMSNYTVSEPESDKTIYEKCGIFEIPVPERADFDHFDTDLMQASETAFDTWDMFKGKNPEGFDTICLRHRRWETEIEIFIGTWGRYYVRPTPKHQVTEIMEDGGWIDYAPFVIAMECEDIFSYMRNNTGLGWIEAMGGADHYLFNNAKPCVPKGAVPLSKEMFYSQSGWIPKQDRFDDGDLFNTSYIRPSTIGTPIHSREMPDKEGYWRVRAMGPYVVFSNIYNLCEIFLTPQGFIMLGGLLRYSKGPQAIRVEYGLAGCVSGYNKFFCLPNAEARKVLGLPCPLQVFGDTPSVQKLREWTDVCGWHNLEQRLFKRGKTEQEVVNEIVREIRWMEEIKAFIDPGAEEPTEFFEYKETVVQFIGHVNGWPKEIVDYKTKQVLWRMGQGFQLDHPWASDNFVLKSNVVGGKKHVTITSKEDGKLVAEYDDELSK